MPTADSIREAQEARGLLRASGLGLSAAIVIRDENGRVEGPAIRSRSSSALP
jgi:hypothetical protein